MITHIHTCTIHVYTTVHMYYTHILFAILSFARLRRIGVGVGVCDCIFLHATSKPSCIHTNSTYSVSRTLDDHDQGYADRRGICSHSVFFVAVGVRYKPDRELQKEQSTGCPNLLRSQTRAIHMMHRATYVLLRQRPWPRSRVLVPPAL